MIGDAMNMESLIKRLDDLENQVSGFDKNLKMLGEQIGNIENKIIGLPSDYRDLKDDIGQLKKTIAGMSGFDSALSKIRTDYTDRFGRIENEAKVERDQQTKQYQADLRALNAKLERIDEKVKKELDQKINRYIEEDSRILSTVEMIEQSVSTKLKSDDDIRRNLDIQKRDIQKLSKRVEIITDDISQFPKQIAEIANSLSVFSEDKKQVDITINEIKATETQRKIAQDAFIEQQEINHKNREVRFDELYKKTVNEIQPIAPMIEKLARKEKEINSIKDDLEQKTKLYERRLKEVSELYQLFEAKYQKEWDVFKADTDKKWSNFVLINEEKQSASLKRLEDLMPRLVAIEDKTKDVQELLGMMSVEIQKGMLNLMKMANNWKDAFDTISDEQK